MSSTGITDKAGPTDIDIAITTDGAKRKTKGSRNYLGSVKKRYEKYIKIKEKFSPKKRQIAEDIVKALLPGRFMKKDNGQWKVLSTEDAVDRVMQRFCDERAYRARKAKAAKTTKKAKVSKADKTKKSCKIVKSTNTNVSKAAKVATDTTPSTPKGEPTAARQHVITPTSDNEKSFESIELTRTPTSVAVPIYFSTPVVEVEKDLTSSDTLATVGGVDDVLELFDDLGEPTMAHQHVVAPTNDTDMPCSTEGGVDDWPNDELQILRDLFPEINR